jgi:hypothetical protein
LKKLGDLVDKVLSDIGLNKITRRGNIWELWTEMAGPLSERAKVMDFRGGILWVAVKGASLRHELELRKGGFLREFWKRGFKEVEDIKRINWRE